MKKFVCVILCAVLTLGLGVLLVGCNDNNGCQCTTEQLHGDYLADKEVGYEVPVYPNFEFDYKLESGRTIHISSIKVTLCSKNEIKPDEPFSGTFYPYAYKIQAKGYTRSTVLAGSKITLFINCTDANTTYGSATVQQDGTLEWEWNFFLYRGLADRVIFHSLS